MIFALVLSTSMVRADPNSPALSSPQPHAQPDLFALSASELDQLLAPIALYSDDLLAQVLMAATYPLDIVEADRWNQSHLGWSPGAVQAAAADQPWDPSVKALLPFSQLLTTLDENLGWTEKIGEAFLAQRADVADSIQRLRQLAAGAGTLISSPEQQVSQDGSALVITPTNADVVYVPVYQPATAFGSWPWADAAPVVLAAPTGGIWVGPMYWCTPVVAGSLLWGTWNWSQHDVGVVLPRYNNAYNPHLASPIWGFVSAHRRGVPFNLANLRGRYPALAQATPARAAISGDQDRVAKGLAWRPPTVVRAAPVQPGSNSPIQAHSIPMRPEAGGVIQAPGQNPVPLQRPGALPPVKPVPPAQPASAGRGSTSNNGNGESNR
jgi:hypothetical protein